MIFRHSWWVGHGRPEQTVAPLADFLLLGRSRGVLRDLHLVGAVVGYGLTWRPSKLRSSQDTCGGGDGLPAMAGLILSG
jgi:hypothetical protein